MMNFPAPFGRYLLLEKIATGGMAEIFKAKLIGVEGFEKIVVIKRILPFWSERREFVTMLVDEAKVLVHLNHPNIVQVYELGRVNDTYFICMEYVEGSDLRHFLNKIQALQRQLPQEIAITIMLEALQGLSYAHQRSIKDRGDLGIVHRDISPQNILLSLEGDIKVTDFGIAKAVTQTHETQTGVLKGKYAYMSPEQATGQQLDQRSDLFSWGLVLFELLFQEKVFRGRTDLEILDKVRRADIVWPQEKLKDLLPGVEAILRKTLALQPQERFQDTAELMEVLEKCLPGGRRIGVRSMAQFFKELFGEELLLPQESEPEQTDSQPRVVRKTLVSSPQRDVPETLVIGSSDIKEVFSRAAVPSEREARLVNPSPKSKFRGLMAASASLIFLSAGVFGYFYFEKKTDSPKASNLSPNPEIPSIGSANFLFPAENGMMSSINGNPTPPSDLMPAAPAPTEPRVGSLWLRSQPELAMLKVMSPQGEQSAQGELKLSSLPLGAKIQVVAELKGYESLRRELTVSPENSNPEILSLRKIETKMGSVTVTANPWGKISVQGKGTVQSLVAGPYRLAEGNYRVTVSHPNSGTFSATASTKGGREASCFVDFEKNIPLSCR